MKTKLFVWITGLVFTFFGCKAQSNNSLNRLIRPFLDSLRVVIPDNNEDLAAFRLESFFPASRVNDSRFDDFSTVVTPFVSYTPENDKINGIITDKIPLFDNIRLCLDYALRKNGYKDEVIIGEGYSFVSRAEILASGEKFIRQTLYMNTVPDKAENGFVEVRIFDRDEDREVEIGKPVYRHILVSKEDTDGKYARYLLRDSEGVYSPIGFTEGSDCAFPEFKGGRKGFFLYTLKYMKYPTKALAERLEGNVLVSATITEKGDVKDIKIISHTDPVFDKEAIRLVKKSAGKWIPAVQNGQNVADDRTIPVQFSLDLAPQW